MDNEDVLTFMRQGFAHMGEKIDELSKAAEKRDLHYQSNFRELYNENKNQNDRATAEREKIMTEVEAKFTSISNRQHVVENSITEIRTEAKVREKSFTGTLTIVSFGIGVLTFAINFLLR